MDDKDFIRRFFGLKQFIKVMKETQIANNIRRKKDKATSENARKAGNDLYAQKNHDKKTQNHILMEYTKSIAYAPQESEELALAFGNRSALHLHLRRYEDCIIDIDRALKITKSNQLKSKLQTRKEKCLILISDCKITNKSLEDSVENLKLQDGVADKQLELPDITTSQKIPCAADSVMIESNRKYTRQMTATRDIKPGEIVSVEKAYTCSVITHQMYLACSHCLMFAWTGIPCDSCVYCIYCSEKCKREAWAECHDSECAILPSIYSILSKYSGTELEFDLTKQGIGMTELTMQAKLFIKAIKTEGLQSLMDQAELIDNGTLNLFSNGEFHSHEFSYIYSMHGCPQNEILSFNECSKEALVLYLLVKRTDLIPIPKKLKYFSESDERLLLRLLKILRNLRNILESTMRPYQLTKCTHEDFKDCTDKCISVRGAFVAPCTTFFNHSCVPNLSAFYLPESKIIVYASRPIKKGEQLFLSIGPLFTTDLAKRKSVLNSIDLTCRCPACKDNRLFQSVNMITGKPKLKKVQFEFKKAFGDGCFNFFVDEINPAKWTIFTQASLEQALKLIELYYKHFQFHEACIYTIPFKYYVKKVFYKLYGGKCDMTSHC